MAHLGFQPEIIAHRGVRTLADPAHIVPENTVPAFQQAAQAGASIELDVITTTDGALVVHHDDESGRIFHKPNEHNLNGDRFIRNMSLDKVQQLVFNPSGHEKTVQKMLGAQIPYQTPDKVLNSSIPKLDTVLDEVWKVNPTTHFYIETKTHNRDIRKHRNNNLEQHLADLIRTRDLYDRVTVISFSTASLRKIKKIDPKIKTGLDIKIPEFWITRPWALKGLVWFTKHVLKADSIHPQYAAITEPLVQLTHAAGLRITPWVDSETRLQETERFPALIEMGVDGIITNAVDQLQQTLQTKPSAPF